MGLTVFHPGAVGKVLPLTDSLGLLHGVSCSQDVSGFKGHHGLHFKDGCIGQRVVHAVFGSVKIKKTIKLYAALADHWIAG